MLERILKNAGRDALLYFPVRLVPALTSLITVPLFTRAIGTADYGYFYLITSTTSLATSIAVGWIGSAIVRYYWIARKNRQGDEFTASTFWLTTVMLVIATVVLAAGFWIFRGSFDPGLLALVPVGLTAFFVSSLYTNLLQVVRAANRAKVYAILSVSMTLLTTLLAIWFVWGLGWGSLGILAGTAIGHAVLLPFIGAQVGREGSLSPREFDREFAREFFIYGFPLTIAGMSSWILVLSDRYVIGFLRDASEVGLYSVAYGLGDKIMQLVTAPMLMTIGPQLVEAFERHGQDLAEKTQTQFTRYYAMVTVPLFAGLTVAAADFMATFTGPAYRSAYTILPIVAAGVLFNGLAQLGGTGLGLHKKSNIIMQNTLAAAILNVTGNLLLVGRFGYMASAWMTLVSYLFLLFITWYRTRPYMTWRIPWLDLGRIAVAAAIMAGVVALAFSGVSDSAWILVAEAALGLVVYAVAVLLVGALRPAERAWLLHGFRTRVLRRPPGGGDEA